jgi:hypothetical protein
MKINDFCKFNESSHNEESMINYMLMLGSILICPGVLLLNDCYIVFHITSEVFVLDLITTISEHRRLGNCSTALKFLCKSADATNTTIELLVDSQLSCNTSSLQEFIPSSCRTIAFMHASKGPKMNNNLLHKLYSKYGFVNMYDNYMIRKPNL